MALPNELEYYRHTSTGVLYTIVHMSSSFPIVGVAASGEIVKGFYVTFRLVGDDRKFTCSLADFLVQFTLYHERSSNDRRKEENQH